MFNAYPLANYNLKKLRQEIGIYLATADLFSGTLHENLTLGDKSISTSFILEVVERTGLLPFVQSLPEGLAMRIDSIGKKLPRNTVNKILLTRALLTQPRLLLLEDCWSGLEKIEQERMLKTLTDKANEFTLIAITNDENFARKCDKIILLHNGRIIKCGDFATVSKTEEYQKMFKSLSL